MAAVQEAEQRTYKPLLTTTEINLLDAIRDRRQGVFYVTPEERFFGNWFRTEFEATPAGKELSLGIRETTTFQVLDFVQSRPISGGEELIEMADFDIETKKRLLLTLFINRAVTYERLAEEHFDERRLEEAHKDSARVARQRVDELLEDNPGLQVLEQEEIVEMLGTLVDGTTYEEPIMPDKAKLLIGLVAITAISLYFLKNMQSRKALA